MDTTKCPACGGEQIVDGKCSACGAAVPATTPETPASPETPAGM